MFKTEDRIWIKELKTKGVIKEVEGAKFKCTYFFNDERKTDWFEVNQLAKFKKKDIIYFAKVKPDAIIPSKDEENAGHDIYACLDEDYIKINPHETKLIPTGIASCFKSKYVLVLKERGSTGTKGIAQRCGIIDSGFRNEIFCPITNTNNVSLYIIKPTTNLAIENNSIVYPTDKAICQAILLPVPSVITKEITYEELKNISSKRGLGQLGSSGK